MNVENETTCDRCGCKLGPLDDTGSHTNPNVCITNLREKLLHGGEITLNGLVIKPGGPYPVDPKETYTCRHGKPHPYGWNTCLDCGEDAQTRRTLEAFITMLESDPQLAQRFRNALAPPYIRMLENLSRE